MRWAYRIGKASGIDVYIHVTFPLLLLFIAYQSYSGAAETGNGVAAALTSVVFVLLVFGIVVLHELGHALAARHYGVGTRDITLYPIGGVARLEHMPSDPWQEFVIAIAGPAVNIFIAALLFGVLSITGELGTTRSLLSLNMLMIVNIGLALFNFIPAFPMDGGRILRALLAMMIDYTTATTIAATVGKGMALLFTFLHVFLNFGSPMILFIALVVWFGASQEVNVVQLRHALSGTPVAQAMIRRYLALEADAPLRQASQYIIDSFQTDFPVLDHGRVVGILSWNDLTRGLSAGGEEAKVRDAMTTEFPTTHPGEMLDCALERLQMSNCTTMVVLQGEETVGLLTLENIGELLTVRRAAHEEGA